MYIVSDQDRYSKKLISMMEFCERINISRSTVERKIAEYDALPEIIRHANELSLYAPLCRNMPGGIRRTLYHPFQAALIQAVCSDNITGRAAAEYWRRRKNMIGLEQLPDDAPVKLAGECA